MAAGTGVCKIFFLAICGIPKRNKSIFSPITVPFFLCHAVICHAGFVGFLDTLQKIELVIRTIRHREKTRLYLASGEKIPKEALHEAQTILESLGRMMILLNGRRDALATRRKQDD